MLYRRTRHSFHNNINLILIFFLRFSVCAKCAVTCDNTSHQIFLMREYDALSGATRAKTTVKLRHSEFNFTMATKKKGKSYFFKWFSSENFVRNRKEYYCNVTNTAKRCTLRQTDVWCTCMMIWVICHGDQYPYTV